MAALTCLCVHAWKNYSFKKTILGKHFFLLHCVGGSGGHVDEDEGFVHVGAGVVRSCMKHMLIAEFVQPIPMEESLVQYP